MHRAKLVILIACLPLFGFTCAYNVRDMSVAPSYLKIAQGGVGLDVLVNDFERVVEALKGWAENTEFKEGFCPPYGGVDASPAVFYLCGSTTKIRVVFVPVSNSTSIELYDEYSIEGIDKVVPSIKEYMVSKFGLGSVIEHEFDPY